MPKPSDEHEPLPDPTPEEKPQETETPIPASPDPKAEDGKVIQVKHSDFKRIKDEAEAKGRLKAAQDLDAAAVTAGFKSAADAFVALGEIKKKAAAPAQITKPEPEETMTMPKPITPPAKKPTPDKAAVESAKLSEERQKMRKQWKREEKAKRDLQRQLDAKEAEMELIKEMHGYGVSDTDYAGRLLFRELQGKSVEEVSKFDRKVFFDSLRSSKPYLFGEKIVPATTGTNGAQPDAGNPTPPAAGDPAAGAAAKTQFDAMKASPKEVEDRLRRLGLNPHL